MSRFPSAILGDDPEVAVGKLPEGQTCGSILEESYPSKDAYADGSLDRNSYEYRLNSWMGIPNLQQKCPEVFDYFQKIKASLPKSAETTPEVIPDAPIVIVKPPQQIIEPVKPATYVAPVYVNPPEQSLRTPAVEPPTTAASVEVAEPEKSGMDKLYLPLGIAFAAYLLVKG